MRSTIRLALSAALILFSVAAIEPALGQPAEPGVASNGPADLADAIALLDLLLKSEDIETLRNGSEDDMSRYHHGLGMSLRGRWGLWGGSALALWFNERGIYHPDDMSAIILTSYWRHLNDRPRDLEGQIRFYQTFWEAHASPERFACPDSDTFTSWVMQFSDKTEDGWDVVHVTDCGDGDFWAHEQGRGWYPAPADLVERIHR